MHSLIILFAFLFVCWCVKHIIEDIYGGQSVSKDNDILDENVDDIYIGKKPTIEDLLD